jgi:hypothetical protein
MGMTETRTWHATDDTLRRWVDGAAGEAVSMSVEAHLLSCPQCRTTVAGLVPTVDLEPAWSHVLAVVEVPRATLAQRLLLRLGVGSSDATIVASAVTLRAGWLLGMIGVLAFAVVSSIMAAVDGLGMFLVVAPLVPVAGVAAAYGPSVDPMYHAVQAAPYPMIRLVLLRTASVLVTSVPVVAVAGLLMPAPGYVAVAWLLPSAGFVVVVLAASNWFDPVHVSTALAIGWVVAVALAVHSDNALDVFAPAALVTYVAALVIAGATFLHRLLGATPSWRLR